MTRTYFLRHAESEGKKKDKFLIFLLLLTVFECFFSFPLFSQESKVQSSSGRLLEKTGDFTIAGLEIFAIDLGGGFANNLLTKNPKGMNLERIKESISRPWIFDNSGFERNQFIHPLAGALYYTAARANGLNFYESAFMAGLGSWIFENLCTYGNTSINDMITTTVAGTIYGEMLHRLSLTLYNLHPLLGWIVNPLDCLNMYARKNRPTENIGSIYYTDAFLGASFFYNKRNKSSSFNFSGGSLIIYENPFGRTSIEPFDNFSLDINFFTNLSKYLVSIDADGTLYSWQFLHGLDALSSIGLMLNYRVTDSDDYKYSDNSFGLFMRQKLPLSKDDNSYFFAWDCQLNFAFFETDRILNKNYFGYGLESAVTFALELKRFSLRLNSILNYELQRQSFHMRNKFYLDFKLTPNLCLGLNDYFMIINDDYIRNYTGLYLKIRYQK